MNHMNQYNKNRITLLTGLILTLLCCAGCSLPKSDTTTTKTRTTQATLPQGAANPFSAVTPQMLANMPIVFKTPQTGGTLNVTIKKGSAINYTKKGNITEIPDRQTHGFTLSGTGSATITVPDLTQIHVEVQQGAKLTFTEKITDKLILKTSGDGQIILSGQQSIANMTVSSTDSSVIAARTATVAKLSTELKDSSRLQVGLSQTSDIKGVVLENGSSLQFFAPATIKDTILNNFTNTANKNKITYGGV